MRRTLIITLLVLMGLTIIVGILSGQHTNYLIPLILSLAALKFLLVIFYFMDLRKAHKFWKIVMINFTLLLFAIILLMQQA